jgi:hypothetical protein
VTPCSPSEVNGLSGGTYRLHLHGWRVSQTSNQQYDGLLDYKSTLQPRWWKQDIPPKRRLTFNGMHLIISQNIELFVTTAVSALSIAISGQRQMLLWHCNCSSVRMSVCPKYGMSSACEATSVRSMKKFCSMKLFCLLSCLPFLFLTGYT